MKYLLVIGGSAYSIATVVASTKGGVNLPLLFVLVICLASVGLGIYLFKKKKD